MVSESRVGSKGELFPGKEIREKLGLSPHTRVIYRVEDGRLIVEPVPSLDDLLTQTPEIEITQEELDAERRELSRKAER
jgi:bifunctional DNA-binding transcriptional regulator/antitoxin component of YhaV-PrlF toxin-antitoxin module